MISDPSASTRCLRDELPIVARCRSERSVLDVLGPQANDYLLVDVALERLLRRCGIEMSRDGSDSVRVIIDHGSVEIFADDGLSVMTALIFPGGVPGLV